MSAQPDFFDTDLEPIDEMSHDKLAHLIVRALKDGRIDRDTGGPALGLLRALKQGWEISLAQDRAARRIMKSIRRDDPLEDQRLIDDGDTLVDEDDAPALVGDSWEEFR